MKSRQNSSDICLWVLWVPLTTIMFALLATRCIALALSLTTILPEVFNHHSISQGLAFWLHPFILFWLSLVERILVWLCKCFSNPEINLSWLFFGCQQLGKNTLPHFLAGKLWYHYHQNKNNNNNKNNDKKEMKSKLMQKRGLTLQYSQRLGY